MLFNIGDIVSRNSYKNDVLFKIVEIDNDVAILEGVNIRLSADSLLDDLRKEDKILNDDNEILSRFNDDDLNRSEFFYLPGKVLHIDSDKDYLKRCMKFYEKVNIKAKGVRLKESEIKDSISSLLDEYKP